MAQFLTTIGHYFECAIQTELVVELELALIETWIFYSRGSARRSCQCVIRSKLPPSAVDCLDQVGPALPAQAGSELADSHGRGRSRHASRA